MRPSKRRKVVVDDSDDEFGMDAATEAAMAADEEGESSIQITMTRSRLTQSDMDDFVVPDGADEGAPVSKKRRRPSKDRQSGTPSAKQISPAHLNRIATEDEEIPTESTARQWTYDPEHPERLNIAVERTPSTRTPKKAKAHVTEPAARYTWLADLRDADRHPPDHPDYDPRTVYIPPLAWANFSPFEKQYWEIKQKFWDTIVFFKKGKFYELYEHDATIGHQLFDLKLTDRVNMRMVGVPEAVLEHWAAQFVGHGYKIARVDQVENKLAKEMRERDEKTLSVTEKKQLKDAEKVIRRELSTVLTSGTLVDGGMLQTDQSTYVASIKEAEKDDRPCFGIVFADMATSQFHFTEFTDDKDYTRFETFVAQIRPRELIVEKAKLSSRASKIIKNNTSANTDWNVFKSGKEFWPGDITCREIDAYGYFISKERNEEGTWPAVLQKYRDCELAMSAFGALLHHLRSLKLDRETVSLGNFEEYDPIRKATSLVLDGQSLINLEIFANTVDGGSDGTLFSMLNHCVTPFGKRLLRQWVCLPLVHASRINERLDAVDALIADRKTQDTFSSSLSKLPDLERLISRVHAGRCKAEEFVKVLDGFEQVEYTMSLLGSFGSGEGLLGLLVSAMPDVSGALEPWKGAFDKELAKVSGVLVPEPGVEEDYDESRRRVAECEAYLDKLLNKVRNELNCSTIKFKDLGKEIYQLEIPVKVKAIPKHFDQTSATAQVKRYYTPELRKLVRNLQEARETNAQCAKEAAGRFYARFDVDFPTWLAATKIIAQLDCLISLARASVALGNVSCRPKFVNDTRSVLHFEDLRHPTMLTAVDDFIPNSIGLGGEHPNINLLTGANAAGKSTILRMTCVAVILAQLGCYVPCTSATLTPVDRIMSRLGANDNIMQQQSTFFVELAETKKILSEATPRSLVILDELGRGTSSVDGLSVAEAVLHHIASHIGCTGFFATHYHSVATEFASHPEVRCMRMGINVDDEARQVTFLYKLEDGVAEGSFGMHCASMCGIPRNVVERAEEAAERWEHSGRVQEVIEKRQGEGVVGLGWLSDLAACLAEGNPEDMGDGGSQLGINARALEVLCRAVDAM